MRPVLFEVFGIPINSYGVSKAAAALVAGYLLAREFRRLGWDPDRAWSIVLSATVMGFVGGKLYYLAEHRDNLTAHSFGTEGFTWYGGLIAGALTVFLLARRYRLPPGQLAGLTAVPLSVAYGIGRIGCFLSGDGTYGTPSDLPWAMAFPNGTMPTLVPVHPTALYEAIVALAIGGLLWALRTRWTALTLFGGYAILTGAARFLVEEVRLNAEALLGLTQPQLWSLVLVGIGIVLVVRDRSAHSRGRALPAAAAG